MSKPARGTKRHQQPQKLPSIALCVIVKDEEEFLADCLESARPFVDEIVVVDTGSTDRTREIALEHGARVEEFVWCDDFSAARNAALDAATADWILILDADERLRVEGTQWLGKIAAALPADSHGYVVEIQNQHLKYGAEGSINHYVTRFFPRRPSLRFVGAIHEEVTYVPDPSATNFATAGDLSIVHYGYDADVYAARGKDARNIRLLEAELQRNPDQAQLYYYLAQQHHGSNRYAEAAHACEVALERSHSLRKPFTVELYRMWLNSLAEIGDFAELERVAAVAESAQALSPSAREVLATQDTRRGRHDAARRQLNLALEPDAPVGLAWAPGTGSWRTRALLADVHQSMGDVAGALALEEQMFGDIPKTFRRNLALQAANIAVRGKQYATAYTWLPRAAAEAGDDVDAHLGILQLRLAIPVAPPPGSLGPTEVVDAAISARDWQAAYDAVNALQLDGAESLARVLFVATRLRDQQVPEAALDLLGRALDAYPTSAPLYWLLIDVLTELQRFDDALAAVEMLRWLPGGQEATLAA
jgi:glycosyltransferase involved in cell wall biosynthesis